MNDIDTKKKRNKQIGELMGDVVVDATSTLDLEGKAQGWSSLTT
jgi:hypothetical protein